MVGRIWVLSSVSKRKMENRFYLILFIFFSFIGNSSSQQNKGESSILFYNVENLFDTKDNPKTDDENFTPDGEMHWTNARFNDKLLKISKVIISSAGWKVPDLIVLGEIENRYVLERLTEQQLLKPYSYKIIHKESPDHRGIDVGFLYNPENFFPLEYNYIPLEINDKTLESREILYVSGIFNKTDTIHIFGNHWPSRYSGLLETESMRKTAALLLRSKVDELNTKYVSPKIVIVGDFNDGPEDESISDYLKAEKIAVPIKSNTLYNLFHEMKKNESGTLKYQSQWFVFDQIIVSGSLLNAKSGYCTNAENAKIVALPFLIEDDLKFGGKKPFRTFYGFSYNGGFSDHLPVILHLNRIN